jgi:hypothetical protein
VFNYFQARVSGLMADAETLGHVLLSHLQTRANNASLNNRVTDLAAE